jgi:hypothetical protein
MRQRDATIDNGARAVEGDHMTWTRFAVLF